MLNGGFRQQLPNLIKVNITAVAPEIAVKSCGSLAAALSFGDLNTHNQIVDACLPFKSRYAVQSSDTHLRAEAWGAYEILLEKAADHGENVFDLLINGSPDDLLKASGDEVYSAVRNHGFTKQLVKLRAYASPGTVKGLDARSLRDRIHRGDKSAFDEFLSFNEKDQWDFAYSLLMDDQSSDLKKAIMKYASERFPGELAVNSDWHGILPVEERLELAQKAAKSDKAFAPVRDRLLAQKGEPSFNKTDPNT